MVINGAVGQQTDERGQLHQMEGLPDLELGPAGRSVLERRYLQPTPEGPLETPRQRFWEVATAVASGSAGHEGDEAQARRRRDYYLAMARLEFLPAVAILANAGRAERRPYLTGYVLPIPDSADGLLALGQRIARVRQLGGGVGLPLPYWKPERTDAPDPRLGTVFELLDAASRLTRGDAVGPLVVLVPVDHPDILPILESTFDLSERDRSAFELVVPYLGPELRAALKRALLERWWDDIRLVVGVTDRFMLATVRGEEYDLVDPRSGAPTGRAAARTVFGRLVRAAWERGQPGAVFVDRLSAGPANPVRERGPLRAVTPDGEAVYANEACALGYLNLARFCRPRPPRNGQGGSLPGLNGSSNGHAGFTRHPALDWEGLCKATRLAVRFLDDVISASPFPDDEIAEAVRANRRIGIGVMGWADLLAMLQVPYDSPPAVELAEEVVRFIHETAVEESCSLAEARGPFPLWQASIYRDGRPRRNATVTAVGVTGPISLIAGCSSGTEPYAELVEPAGGPHDGRRQPVLNPLLLEAATREEFWSEALAEQIVRTGTVRGLEAVPEYWQRVFATAADIAPEWHVRMQAAFQRHAENAVPKTIRLPETATVEEVERVFRQAYELGCHAVNVHRDGATVGHRPEAPDIRTATSAAPSEHLRTRPRLLQGLTYQQETPLGTAYVTINVDDEGAPFEVFVNQGKTGSDVGALSVAIGKLASLALRLPSPMSPAQRLREVGNRLRGIGGGSTWGSGPERARSLPDALARVLESYLQDRVPPDGGQGDGAAAEIVPSAQLALPLAPTGDFCPDCSNALVFEEGRSKCRQCGLSSP